VRESNDADRRRALLKQHQIIAAALPSTPDIVEIARGILRKPKARRGAAAEIHKRWQEILDLPPQEIAEVITAVSAEADALRAASPLIGAAHGFVNLAPRQGRARAESTKEESKLASARLDAQLTQEEMARATGIPLSTYWRLERRRIPNPPVGYLAACARVLGVPLLELMEDEWSKWGVKPKPSQ
jgi:DNA-binding XRE family transcriptional regulator